MESVKSIKYQYEVGHKTTANLVSGRFGAFKVEEMLQQQRTDFYFTEEITFAIIDGRPRCSCIQKLADSGEPGTKWPSQLIGMTLIEAPGFQSLTDHELLRLSPSRSLMTELVLRDVNFIAVSKSFVQ